VYIEHFLNVYLEHFLNVYIEHFLNVYLEHFLNVYLEHFLNVYIEHFLNKFDVNKIKDNNFVHSGDRQLMSTRQGIANLPTIGIEDLC
jgi:hypothetical protein